LKHSSSAPVPTSPSNSPATAIAVTPVSAPLILNSFPSPRSSTTATAIHTLSEDSFARLPTVTKSTTKALDSAASAVLPPYQSFLNPTTITNSGRHRLLPISPPSDPPVSSFASASSPSPKPLPSVLPLSPTEHSLASPLDSSSFRPDLHDLHPDAPRHPSGPALDSSSSTRNMLSSPSPSPISSTLDSRSKASHTPARGVTDFDPYLPWVSTPKHLQGPAAAPVSASIKATTATATAAAASATTTTTTTTGRPAADRWQLQERETDEQHLPMAMSISMPSPVEPRPRVSPVLRDQ
ncbi:hypothetical protein BGW38_009007, partial [Lunasporangiospora selenospora]